MTYTIEDEQSMLDEVATWHRGAHEDFKVFKGAKHGIYSYHFAQALGGMRVVVELSEAEATIFNRHMTFPATRADLEDLPRRLTVAKLKLLIS